MKKVIGIAGWSGSGKTTLVENLIKIFKKKYNLKISVLKHAHKNFSLDKKGKDSYRFSSSGADQVLISSKKQWAIVNKIKENELRLSYLLKFCKEADIVLVEGWKHSNLKKIEIYRTELNKNFLYTDDKNIIAIASDNTSIKTNRKIKLLDINNHLSIAEFIINNDFGNLNDKV